MSGDGAGPQTGLGAEAPNHAGAPALARWPGVLGLLVTVALWGSTVPAIAVLSQRWDPYFLAMIRYIAALPLFWLLLRVLEPAGASFQAAIAPWRLLALGTAMACFATLYTLGIAHSHPVTAVVFAASMPVIANLVVLVVQGVLPNRRLLAGLAMVVPGAALAMAGPGKMDGTLQWGGGEPLIVLAMICWSWYSLMAQRWMGGTSALRITARTANVATLVLIAFYGLAAAGGQTYGAWHAIGGLDLTLMALLSYGVIVTAVILWNNGVARLGLPMASLYLNLVPAVTLAILMAMGIPPSLSQVSGAVLVVAGILIAQLWNRRRK